MIHLLGFHTTFFQILGTIFGIGILVFIHELGHFIMAKRFKIKVEQFAFGFGPEIIGFTYGGTRYSLCAIPLGGMVKMPGEDINTATGQPDEFMSQAWYRRFIIAFCGPLMNYILAVFLFIMVIYFWGMSMPSTKPVVGDVMDGYPAKAAGMLPGDTVTSIDGVAVQDWQQMADIIHASAGKKLNVGITRGGTTLAVILTPSKDPGSGVGLVGIAPVFDVKKVSLPESCVLSVKMVVFQTVYTVKYLGIKIVRLEKPELAGPIGVVQILAKAAKLGIENLLHFLAVISVALGLFNLFPIPLVDGGHMMLALVEALTRKPLNKKAVQVSNMVGLGIIICIFIFATSSDLARLGLTFGR